VKSAKGRLRLVSEPAPRSFLLRTRKTQQQVPPLIAIAVSTAVRADPENAQANYDLELALLVAFLQGGGTRSNEGSWGVETRSGGELVFVDGAAEEVAPAQGR